MKFSTCGKLLASAGKDQIIRIWVLKSFYEYFSDQISRQNNSESLKYPESSFKRNVYYILILVLTRERF
jgi:hypothetical protein